ncbi:MAG: low molecular weight phosphotyrosine protein phosphatase [Clostridia bacterium]|nr:low molecular weight phosphotyrosine protein phosphatase [Clostridia bacterium]
MKQIRIMFVCHGNICRSPTAEFVLRDMVRRAGLDDRFTIASSATSAEEIRGGIGKTVYPPAAAELRRHGIDCTGKRAVQLRADDYDQYDLFIGMDSANLRNMYRILAGDPEGKIRRLMDYTDRGGDVADPWYSERFDVAYRDIEDGCAGLLRTLTK